MGEGRGLTEHGCEEDGGGEEDVSVHAESVVWEEILFDDLSRFRWVIELVWIWKTKWFSYLSTNEEL